MNASAPRRSTWFWLLGVISVAKLFVSLYSQQGNYFKDWTALLYLALTFAVLWQLLAGDRSRELWTLFVSMVFCFFVVLDTQKLRKEFQW